jgi:hypothetical protein
VARHDSEDALDARTGRGAQCRKCLCGVRKRSRGFDRGCNLAEQSESQTTWNPSMWLVPLQPYPGPAMSFFLTSTTSSQSSPIPSLRSCHPSPCDMGLSAMDNDGASPSIIVPVRLLVEMVQCHFVLSGCYLAHEAISSSWVLCTPNQPSQCRRRASSTLHRGWVRQKTIARRGSACLRDDVHGKIRKTSVMFLAGGDAMV